MKRCRKGFTLIELLVVIAIIAILAAILFPAFAMAKRSAAKTTCTGNLKQIGSAILMYVDQNNGRYPMDAQYSAPPGVAAADWDCSPNVAARCVWTFRPYCKSLKVWMCPSGGQRKFKAATYDIPRGRTTASGTGYLWPAWGGGYIDGELVCTNYVAYAFNQHPATAEHTSTDYLCARGKTPVQFCMECRRDGYQPWLVQDSYTYATSAGSQWAPHRGGLNGCFYDGHIQWVRDKRFENMNGLRTRAFLRPALPGCRGSFALT